MRNLVCAGVCMLLSGGCRAPTPPPPDFRPTATVKDIMDALVDPSADLLWDSVEIVATLNGTSEKAPKTDAEWQTLRRHAIGLVEASNLLIVPGRRIARPGEQAGDPRIDLQPEQIEALVSGDRAGWIALSHGLHDAALASLKAIESKDKTALLYAGANLDQACENCHLKYWYPNIQKPAPAGPGGRTEEDSKGK
jgi:hypothetical protein